MSSDPWADAIPGALHPLELAYELANSVVVAEMTVTNAFKHYQSEVNRNYGHGESAERMKSRMIRGTASRFADVIYELESLVTDLNDSLEITGEQFARAVNAPAKLGDYSERSAHHLVSKIAADMVTSVSTAVVRHLTPARSAPEVKAKTVELPPKEDFEKAVPEVFEAFREWKTRHDDDFMHTLWLMARYELELAAKAVDASSSLTESYLDIELGDREATRGQLGTVSFEKAAKQWLLFDALVDAGANGLTRKELDETVDAASLDHLKSATNDRIEQLELEIQADQRGVWRLVDIKSTS